MIPNKKVKEQLEKHEAMRAHPTQEDAMDFEAGKAVAKEEPEKKSAHEVRPEHRTGQHVILEEETPVAVVKKKKKDGWFRHHYTNDKNLLIRSKRCYTDPVPFPLPPHPATSNATSVQSDSEPELSMMPFDASECHYSILHSPTYKKTQRKVQAQGLEELRNFRTVAKAKKEEETYSSLWWTWRKRSDGHSVDANRECRTPKPQSPEVKSKSPNPLPSPVSIQGSFEVPNPMNKKRRRPYSGYELWKEAGDDPQAKRRVSDVLHKRCHDNTKYLLDPFSTPADEAPTPAWKTMEDCLEYVRGGEEAEVSDEGSEESDDSDESNNSWHTTCSSIDDANAVSD